MALSPCLERRTQALRMQAAYQVQGEGGVKCLGLMSGDRRWLYFFCLTKIEG